MSSRTWPGRKLLEWSETRSKPLSTIKSRYRRIYALQGTNATLWPLSFSTKPYKARLKNPWQLYVIIMLFLALGEYLSVLWTNIPGDKIILL